MGGDRNRLAENAGISSERIPPKTMAEDDNGKLFLAPEKAPAKRHGELGHVEEVIFGQRAPDALCLAMTTDGGRHRRIEGGNIGK
jgi:hypothetical protein